MPRNPPGCLIPHVLLLTLALAGPAAAEQGFVPPSVGDGRLQDSLLFIHPLINYAFDPWWVMDWESNLMRENGLALSVGSVSTDDFLTELRLNITEPIGGPFRFLYNFDWYEGLHLDTQQNEHFLGFELGLIGPAGIQLLAQPTSDKEELDALFGVVLTNDERDNYLRLLFRWDDPLYSQKNHEGGKTVSEEIGPQWTLRFGLGSWILFSQGRYTTPSEREVPDRFGGETIHYYGCQLGESATRLRYRRGRWGFGELAFMHHRIDSGTWIVRPEITHLLSIYENRIADLTLQGGAGLGEHWRVRGLLGRLEQRIDWVYLGDREQTYDRNEWHGAGFVAWTPSERSIWELGYMAGRFDWQAVEDGTASFDSEGHADKVELSWLWSFTPSARLQLSLSHEPNLSRFGGGNLQFMMFF